MNIIEWVAHVGGIEPAAKLLKEAPRTVMSWIYAERLPKPQSAANIVKMTKGKVDYNGIYVVLVLKMAEKESKQLIKKAAQND